MSFKSVYPADGDTVAEVPVWDAERLERALRETAAVAPAWAATPLAERARLLHAAAQVLRARRDQWAQLITLEMGKLTREAQAEVEKSAMGCEYYAAHVSAFLADEVIASDAGHSYVAYQALGTLLAIMPWNFPFWQVFRAAAPALAAGNTVVLKHAANVPQCALALEQVCAEAGFPPGVFRTLMIRSGDVAGVIADARIHGVTLTGSESAGRQVAAAAGAHLKKAVLELGGADPFIVLEDADLDAAVKVAITSRFQNAGQSCIAAKRFIVVDGIADDFVECFVAAARALRHGDPNDARTTLAPMARGDLRDELHRQVQTSIAAGAQLCVGGAPIHGAGFYYPATVLDHVAPGMAAYDEELFGPVASVMRVRDQEEAVAVANASRYGLGASVWTRDAARGEAVARRIDSGVCFVNGLVKSDPCLPFGGVKASGYGRELSYHGLREFVNIKTVWINK